MRALDIITLLLVIIGGLNWGLVGLFEFDLVRAIFGDGASYTATESGISRVIYVLVAIAAIYQITNLVRMLSSKARIREIS
ncbi:DUF378 domain-containing protein [Dongia soli]|uniref:DUF378 domain-containing protein n=1 Tax=Dongia soli TaxID=600628 RepID=A0ABU5EE02_9PROT|nr:DUF378 domain-containing protein [Dongia soli]MDY0884537.1 DUF378 domain-containing protein [Dongia soli]